MCQSSQVQIGGDYVDLIDLVFPDGFQCPRSLRPKQLLATLLSARSSWFEEDLSLTRVQIGCHSMGPKKVKDRAGRDGEVG